MRQLTSIVLALTCLAAPAAGQRKAAPEFRLPGSGGSPVQLSNYKGKVVLLNFWATTCGGCKVEIPWFQDFQAQYRSRGLVVIGVAMDDDGWKSVKPYMQEKKLNYTIALGNENMTKLYGDIPSLPMTWLIDRDGRIVSSHTGIVNRDACEKEILTLLH